MNLKEELEKYALPEDVGSVNISISLKDAERIAEEYAKEKAWEWYIKGLHDGESNTAMSYEDVLKKLDENK